MKISYYPDTDSLYIDLVDRPGVDSREVSGGVVVDVDGASRVVGVDIDRASRRVEMQQIVVSAFPGAIDVLAD